MEIICLIDIYAYTNILHQLIMNQRDSYEKNLRPETRKRSEHCES